MCMKCMLVNKFQAFLNGNQFIVVMAAMTLITVEVRHEVSSQIYPVESYDFAKICCFTVLNVL
jgi:hypothetical protein